MVFAAEFGSGQVLWSILWFFLFFMWIYFVISIWADIIRSKDLSGGAKAMWAALIIFLPYLGFFLYIIVRGASMSDRAVERMNQQEDAAQAYIRDAAGGSAADELTKLSQLHTDGTLDDAEYAQAKQRVLDA